ncbi:tol-pal system YbgF family protein [Desulfosarcina sp.]|uniref:tetratricopeptide repeat protein n=1 Tax=Desulfosarcina sp. TaxID=2027861 RepID=UPI0035633BF6
MLRFLIIAIGAPLFLMAMPAHGFARLTIDADSQYRYAQSRLDSGAVDEAVAEFNRFIHFFPADPRVPQARFQTGVAHFRAGRYQAAAAIFNQQTVGFAGSPLDNQAFFMLSRSHARQGMIEQAIVDLHNLEALSSSTDVIDQVRYELGWLHVDQGRWNAADQAFNRISPDNRDRFQVANLKQSLALSGAIPFKHPTTAGFLSIVPGGGQLYTSRYQDAATAFLINAGLIWAAWESFDNEQYALGSMISFVGFGFYAGNIYGAVSSAHKYNRDQINAYRERLNQHRQISLSLAPSPKGAALCLTISF